MLKVVRMLVLRRACYQAYVSMRQHTSADAAHAPQRCTRTCMLVLRRAYDQAVIRNDSAPVQHKSHSSLFRAVGLRLCLGGGVHALRGAALRRLLRYLLTDTALSRYQVQKYKYCGT